MSLTFAKVADSDDVWGRHRTVAYDVTLDSSYGSGGYAITAANVGLNQIAGVVLEGGNSAGAVLVPRWDSVNGKLIVSYPTGGAAASPAALASPVITTGAVTASAVSAATPTITPGQGKEVLATTDLSTVAYRLRFIGN